MSGVKQGVRRSRWAAVGAAVAVTLGAGGMVAVSAAPGDEDSTFVPVEPCRLFDTRNAATEGGPGTLSPGFVLAFEASGNCGVAEDATAVSMNVTIVNPTSKSFLTVYPDFLDRPEASNLNWIAGQSATPNKVDVKLNAQGVVHFFNNRGNVDVFADVVGYYTNSTLKELAAAIPEYERVEERLPGPLAEGTIAGVDVDCPAGKVPLSWGFSSSDGIPTVEVFRSEPQDDNSGWAFSYKILRDTNGSAFFSVTCA